MRFSAALGAAIAMANATNQTDLLTYPEIVSALPSYGVFFVVSSDKTSTINGCIHFRLLFLSDRGVFCEVTKPYLTIEKSTIISLFFKPLLGHSTCSSLDSHVFAQRRSECSDPLKRYEWMRCGEIEGKLGMPVFRTQSCDY